MSCPLSSELGNASVESANHVIFAFLRFCRKAFLMHGSNKLIWRREMKNLFKVDLDVKTMVQLAMFMAITIILGYVNKIIPEMPQGGALISIDVVAIFLCAYLMGAGYGIICGIGVSILQFVLAIATYWGPWSVLLDYVLPLAVCGIAPMLKSTKIKNIPIYWGIILSMILKYLCHFASGAFLFAEYAPEGINPIIYSLTYNLPYNFTTLLLCMVVVPILYKRLKGVLR